MATFVKGDYVQITPQVDYGWKHWTPEHTKLAGKVCSIVEVSYEKWTDQTFLHVEHRGERLWFLDHHAIKVENYEEVFSEALHEAVHRLNETERICKKLRDEILEEAFGVNDNTSDDDAEEEQEESLYDPDDWEEVTTKEVIPLPGNGGTMTTPKDPKATANTNRKKIRKMKAAAQRATNKSSASGSLSSAWKLSDDELEDLQDYLDALPYSNPNTTGDIDFDYDYDDWGDGQGD